MNQSRTYGVEIECLSRVRQSQLSEIVRTALEGTGHSCFQAAYGHDTDSNNTRVWKIKPDSSVQQLRLPAEYQNPSEIVTPVLRGREGLEMLKKVCEAISPFVKVNRSCGLHVHHGVHYTEIEEVVKAWFGVEDNFFKVVAPSRQENSYCRKWCGQYTKPRPNADIQRWWRMLSPSLSHHRRYSSLNLEHYWARGAVEFRFHQGSYDGEKICNWVIATQTFVDRAKYLQDDRTSWDKMLSVFMGEGVITRRVTTAVSQPAPEETPTRRTPNITIWGHKRNTMSGAIDLLILDGHGNEYIIDYLMDRFGRNYRRASKKLYDHIKHLKQEHNVNVADSRLYRRDVRFTHQDEDYRVTEETIEVSAEISPEVESCVEWLKQRREDFENVQHAG